MFEICTVAASCLTGDSGGLRGEMDLPVDVATDGAGNVYVADTNNNRIQRFAEPVVTPPVVTPPPVTGTPTTTPLTGQRAAALKKCKKKKTSKARRKCRSKANKLPV